MVSKVSFKSFCSQGMRQEHSYWAANDINAGLEPEKRVLRT